MSGYSNSVDRYFLIDSQRRGLDLSSRKTRTEMIEHLVRCELTDNYERGDESKAELRAAFERGMAHLDDWDKVVVAGAGRAVVSNVVKRTERGWGGHFICADRCRFRRNTLLELGDVSIVVSTVGAMMSRHENKPERIGVDRYYETMAFHAHKDGAYIEADVSRQVSFESEWSLERWEDDDIDMQADAMHEVVVAEISERLTTGRMESP